MEVDKYKKESLDRVARFYRLHYVVIAGVTLLVFLGIWFWYNKKQAEETQRHLITNCIFSCQRQEAEKIGDKAFSDQSILSECVSSCQKQYGKYK